MLCPKCHSQMSLVYHFAKEESREFYLCNSCYYETRHVPVSFNRIEKKSEDGNKPKKSAQSKDNKEKRKSKHKR